MSRFLNLNPILGDETRPEIQLDWRAYYREFDLRHGGDPVEFEGRLLWRDGWMHSASSHEGPEWRPPLPVDKEGEDDLRKLVKAYWTLRRVKVASQIEELSLTVSELERIQEMRDGPLMTNQVEWHTDEQGRRRIKVTETEVDLQGMRDRLEWLRQLLAECDVKLEEVKGEAA